MLVDVPIRKCFTYLRLDKAARSYDPKNTLINENNINSNHSCKECSNKLISHSKHIILDCKRNEKERKLLHDKLKPLGVHYDGMISEHKLDLILNLNTKNKNAVNAVCAFIKHTCQYYNIV